MSTTNDAEVLKEFAENAKNDRLKEVNLLLIKLDNNGGVVSKRRL